MWKWSASYHGVKHFYNYQIRMSKQHWATITDRGNFSILTKWYPGDTLANARQEIFDTFDEAEKAAEQFVKENE